jgi:acetyl/propionyl-CoA carboxylase alpha subunit/acetyl-CoA carboxylase alpha subunit/acetyl-CoA carboxylase beta subunit
MSDKPQMVAFKSPDPLFLEAEQLAADFSLFPERSPVSLAEHLKGLIDNDKIQARLKEIKQLDVDAYIEQTVLPAQHTKRPGAKDIIGGLNGKIITTKEKGPFYAVEIELPFSSGKRRIGIIAQERSAANGSWLPEHHRMASKQIRRFVELSLPIVFLIDTPGADAGEMANSDNQAHSISQMIVDSTNVHVPTVGIIAGVGYSGGAIPLAAANILLSVRDGIFNTIQPQGLQNIARKFNLSWQECAKSVGVSPEELCTQGCIDGIIDYSPLDRDERQHNLQKAIISSIEAIESAAETFVESTPDLMVHYQRSMARYLHPTEFQKTVENRLPRKLATHPSMLPNIFGLCYRHMRYLTLRGRIRSISSSEYGRLSKMTLPEGDLNTRLIEEKKRLFKNWLETQDKLSYDDQLSKSWKNYLVKLDDRGNERGSITRFILGEPKENYHKAMQALLFNLSFSLYNRWKNSAVHNFESLMTLLEDETSLPVTTSWPALNQLTVMDVISHEELRKPFIEHCHSLLIFDALYDNVVSNLDSIAKEAMEHKALSRQSVADLLNSSLANAMTKFGDEDASAVEASFEAWLRYFLDQKSCGELLVKIEEWKSIGFPQMNEGLFVVLTYYFERLLPEYYESDDDSGFKGAISPVRIGRRKDFWNRLIMGYRDLLIQRLLLTEKQICKLGPDNFIAHFFSNFTELGADKTSANPVDFPGFRQSIEQALDSNIRATGLVTGLADITLNNGKTQRVGIAASNLLFQAGAFDMASAEKFCALLVECAKQHLPVICFVTSGGMQTKEGAAALFSMAVVNDRLTRFIRDHDLPVLMFGYGDCTGGAQASFVTHPMAQSYYFSGTNMPFAGQMVVPAYLPSTSTLSNYLSTVPGAMDGLVKHPLSAGLDGKLLEIDPNINVPIRTVLDVITEVLSDVEQPMIVTTVDDKLETDPKTLMGPINKVLIHARGCTAVKLVRKAQENNIPVVLVASDPDMTAVPALMLTEQDKLVCLGGNSSDESYLNALSVLQVAEYENVSALHPGIGFLSETPHFASLCVKNGINFIGPSDQSMITMGNKSNAIHTVQRVNVPVVPGSHGILSSAEQAANIAEKIGYPVLLKAVHGGGGKGIQVVRERAEMFSIYNMVSVEARAAFGNGDLYLEKFVTSMRHIEVQLLRDKFGNSRVIGMRDCSVQRNNQKMVEESGSTMLPDSLKQQAFAYTLAIADEVGYTGAGTVEFIYNLDDNEIYFMEMNTRLQVEHPVTEATSGVDIVKTQFDIASGGSIEHITLKEEGYAIEVRITAEKIVIDDKGEMQLAPNPGKITHCNLPERDDMEIISIAATDMEISPFYDSLIAQLICRGNNREEVIDKLYDYLESAVIEGIATNIPLLKRILKDEKFCGGNYDTNYLPGFMASLDADVLVAEANTAASAGAGVDVARIRVDDSNELKVFAYCSGVFYTASSPADPEFVKPGDIVSATDTLALMEAMKMFSQVSLASFNRPDAVLYPTDQKYRIESISNSNGQQVSAGDLLYIVSVVED